MNFLEQNLNLVKKYNEKLYNQVNEWLREGITGSFSVVEGRKGDYALTYTDREKVKYLTSAYNPIQEAKRWVDQIDQDPELTELFIVYGFALGDHIKELKKKKIKKIFVIEPHKEIFCLALQYRDLSWFLDEEDKSIHLAIAEPDGLLIGSIARNFRELNHNFSFLPFQSYSTIFDSGVTQTAKLVSEAIGNYIMEVNTCNFFAYQWTKNFFENLYPIVMSPGIKGLFDELKNIPAVIISAGPSLNKNVELLRELKGRALLLCVGTSYKVLKNHGIEPDFITSFDGSEKNYQIFKGLDISGIPLIFDSTINHQIIQDYQGPLVGANVCNEFFSWFEEQLDISKGHVLVGASIANVTFDIARKLGCDPIVFVGQDLAFSEGKTHAKGTIYESERVYSTGSAMEVFVEDIYGDQILSNRSFLTFKRWFEGQIEKYPDRLYIDATEGGAKIKGTEIMPLTEVLERYCQQKYPIREKIQEFLIAEKPDEKELLDKTIELIKEVRTEVEKVNKKGKRALRVVEDLENLVKRSEANGGKIQKSLRILDKFDDDILNFKHGKLFLHHLFHPLILPLLKGPDSKPQPNETEAEERERIVRYTHNLYDGIVAVSKIVQEIIEETEESFLDRLI